MWRIIVANVCQRSNSFVSVHLSKDIHPHRRRVLKKLPKLFSKNYSVHRQIICRSRRWYQRQNASEDMKLKKNVLSRLRGGVHVPVPPELLQRLRGDQRLLRAEEPPQRRLLPGPAALQIRWVHCSLSPSAPPSATIRVVLQCVLPREPQPRLRTRRCTAHNNCSLFSSSFDRDPPRIYGDFRCG